MKWNGLKFVRNLSMIGVIGNMVVMEYVNAIYFGVLFSIVAIGYDIMRGDK